MSHHFLVERAVLRTVSDLALERPRECIYDDCIGAWTLNNQEHFLVKDFLNSGPRYGTKKEDIETGEDQKG